MELKLPRWIIDVPKDVQLDTAIMLSRIIDEVCVLDKLPEGWNIIKSDKYDEDETKYILNSNDLSTKRPLYYSDSALQNPDNYMSEDDDDSGDDRYVDTARGLSVAAAMLQRFVPYKKSPIYKNGLRLRKYQVHGVNWMLKNWYSQRGGILADEMGLGKTCQVICMLEHLRLLNKLWSIFGRSSAFNNRHWKREQLVGQT